MQGIGRLGPEFISPCHVYMYSHCSYVFCSPFRLSIDAYPVSRVAIDGKGLIPSTLICAATLAAERLYGVRGFGLRTDNRATLLARCCVNLLQVRICSSLERAEPNTLLPLQRCSST